MSNILPERFAQFVKQFDLQNPDYRNALSLQDSIDQKVKIESFKKDSLPGLAALSDEQKRSFSRILSSWEKGWVKQERLMKTDFGVASVGSKGAKTEQLKKKAERAERDRQQRNKMKGRK